MEWREWGHGGVRNDVRETRRKEPDQEGLWDTERAVALTTVT